MHEKSWNFFKEKDVQSCLTLTSWSSPSLSAASDWWLDLWNTHHTSHNQLPPTACNQYVIFQHFKSNKMGLTWSNFFEIFWFLYPFFFLNIFNIFDINEILLKVVLNTITLTLIYLKMIFKHPCIKSLTEESTTFA